MTVTVSPAGPEDDDAIWAMLEPVFRAGDSYAIDRDISQAAALTYWRAPSNDTFIAAEGDLALGTYYLKRNQGGGGAHVCNCGFVTSPAARGKGVARAMLAHALQTARAQGFHAMQFNFVVSTNTRAIAIWDSAGFDIVGRLPGAFDHPEHGRVDALVMFKTLQGGPNAR